MSMRLEFKWDRDRDFMESYDKALKELQGLSVSSEEIIARALKHQAKRFYVSEEQAFKIIKSIKLKRHPIKNKLKLEMYKEIIKRVNKVIKETGKNLKDAISEVIYQPAPRFYIDVKPAQILFYQILKSKYI